MRLLTEGKVDQGRSIFLSIIENDSNNAMAHAGIATCYELELDFDESIYYFNLAINLESANFLFHYHLANVYLKKYESIIDLERDSSLINKAISSFQKSLKFNPDHVASLLGIGIAHIKSANHKKAITYFDSVIELKPSISDSYTYKGDCYLYLDNFLEASKCYKLAIKKDGTNFRAYNNLGLCSYKLLNLPLARDYLNKALKINPNYSYAYSNLSSVYLTTDIEKSLKYINKAIALDSTQSSFYTNLSQCYMALGDVEKSKTSLMKALELNYFDFNIYYNLSLLNYSFSDDIIHFLITSSDDKLISPLNRVFIDNTLFNYYDNNKEYSKAYKYL
jgi:tetratricopeptide (TPR) repeat protein